MSEEQKEEHTLAYKIFHYRFRMRLPASFAFEQQYALVGVPQMEDGGSASQTAQEMVIKEMTPNDAIEYWHRGATLIIDNPNDAVTIYQWLRDFLHQQQERVTYKMNIKKVNISDLEKVEAFARSLYRITRNFQSFDGRMDPMDRAIESVMSRRTMRRSDLPSERRKRQESNEAAETPEVAEHEDVVSDISRTVFDRNLKHR